MQRLSYQLITHLRSRVDVRVIKWGGNQWALPFFFLYALVKASYICVQGVDLVHIGDPVLSSIGWTLKRLFHVSVIVTAHGSDITFPLGIYQWLIPRCLRTFDRVVCISHFTYRACVERGIPAQKCTLISPGVTVPPVLPERDAARQQLERALGCDLHDEIVLLTVGRLVPRKGVAWFLETVFPRLVACHLPVRYVVVGTGSDLERVRSLTMAGSGALQKRVHLLGYLPELQLRTVYAAADVFVMPNLPVSGDVEGFGLVALEAAAHALPVVAAALQGIQDAVVLERTGYLLPAGDAERWEAAIADLVADPRHLETLRASARATVQAGFTWEHMAAAYEDLFRQVLEKTTQ
jgi:glycosyltransferase involved in cell wall biosynthesis